MRTRGEPFFCPKGTEGLSLGIEPRFPNKRLCSNGWTRNCDPGLSPQEIAHRYLPPFQAGSRFLAFLGLKPQAESYCPFGTMSSTLTRRVVNRQLGAYRYCLIEDEYENDSLRWCTSRFFPSQVSLFTFHFSPILPDARLVEFSHSTDSVAPGWPTWLIRGVFEAVGSLYECHFIRGDFS
jgi:hypothetical protein